VRAFPRRSVGTRFFTEILEQYASKLDIEDMVEIAQTIGVD
jgi:hypothetical protein